MKKAFFYLISFIFGVVLSYFYLMVRNADHIRYISFDVSANRLSESVEVLRRYKEGSEGVETYLVCSVYQNSKDLEGNQKLVENSSSPFLDANALLETSTVYLLDARKVLMGYDTSDC